MLLLYHDVCRRISRGPVNSLIAVTMEPLFTDSPNTPPPVRVGRNVDQHSAPPTMRARRIDEIAAVLHGTSVAGEDNSTPTLWVINRRGAVHRLAIAESS
jgi:hypothetical protein